MRYHLVKWQKKYANKGLVIFEIDNSRFETLDMVRKSVEKQELKHFVLWDKDGQNHKSYGVKVWPVAYLIGPDGKVVWEGNPQWVLDPPRPGSPRAVDVIEKELKKVRKAVPVPSRARNP